MTWINEHKLEWRSAVFFVFLFSIIGPWTFDRIYVPAEYDCSGFNVRLEGDFCGVPLSGVRFFFLVIGNFFSIVKQVTGEMVLSDLSREILLTTLFLLPLLPLFITVLSLFRGSHQSKSAIVAWGLAIGVGLFIDLSITQPLSPAWGIWLYIGLAAVTLMLELSVLRIYRKTAL